MFNNYIKNTVPLIFFIGNVNKCKVILVYVKCSKFFLKKINNDWSNKGAEIDFRDLE